MSKKKRKKKKKAFGALEQARLRAREAVGMPRPARALPAKKQKPPRSERKRLARELEEE